MKSSIITALIVVAFVACIMTPPVNAILRGMNKNNKRILKYTPNKKVMDTITSTEEEENDDDAEEVSTTKPKNHHHHLRRVVVEGRITLIGINHDTPLTGTESMVLEDTLLDVINEETIDDPWNPTQSSYRHDHPSSTRRN